MSRRDVLAKLLSLFFLIVALYSPEPCSAQGDLPSDSSVQELISEGLSKGKTICAVVGEMIKEGKGSFDTVNNAIVMGHPPCVVVRCAIDAGGKLEDVMVGAYRAGATSDVIVTCLIDSGIPSDVLARTIEMLGLPGLGYTPPAPPGYAPAFSPAIGGGGGGTGTVSPIRP